MGKYADMLRGDSFDPNAIEPPKENKAGKYYEMLAGGTELRQGTLEFNANPTANVSPVNDPSKMAGFGTQAVASLPTDLKERAQYFASKRFPNDKNAIARYGVQDGRLFYQGDDGQTYFEEPKASLSPSEMLKYAGSTAGPALPLAGSIVGGAAGLPGGAASIGLAGAGGAVGDEIRQGLAMTLAGQKNFSPLQTAKEAGGAAFGQTLGVGSAKFINRNAAKDLYKIQDPQAQAKIDYLESAAKEFGLTLTPAEKTGLPSLVSQQNTLGSLPQSSDILKTNLYDPRNTEQVPQAVNTFLQRLSPVESSEVGAQNLQKGAKATIEAEAAKRQAAAKPFYEKSRNVVVSDNDYQLLKKDPFLRQQMEAVMRDPKYQSDIGDLFPKPGKSTLALDNDFNPITQRTPPIDGKIGFLDVVKKRIDGMIEGAKNNDDRRIYTQAKERLLKITDQASPDYAKARSIYEVGSPAVTTLTKGEVGLVAGKKSTQLGTVTKSMFESGPVAVSKNRTAFIKAGKEQEWNDGLRSYLSDQFSKASKEFVSGNANPGARFRSAVIGQPNQKSTMRLAMSSEQWAGFNRLMDVLEATGRVPAGGSRTAFATESIQDMKKQAGGVVSKGMRALNPTNVIDTSRIAKAYEEIKFGKHAETLATIITSPDGMQKLKQLKSLPPRSVKSMAAVSQLLAQYEMGEADSPQDASPGAFSQP